jgi:hypothetical protein
MPMAVIADAMRSMLVRLILVCLAHVVVISDLALVLLVQSLTSCTSITHPVRVRLLLEMRVRYICWWFIDYGLVLMPLVIALYHHLRSLLIDLATHRGRLNISLIGTNILIGILYRRRGIHASRYYLHLYVLPRWLVIHQLDSATRLGLSYLWLGINYLDLSLTSIDKLMLVCLSLQRINLNKLLNSLGLLLLLNNLNDLAVFIYYLSSGLS